MAYVWAGMSKKIGFEIYVGKTGTSEVILYSETKDIRTDVDKLMSSTRVNTYACAILLTDFSSRFT